MPIERTQRTARKLNRAQVLEQAKRGMSHSEIAKQQGVNKSTVLRFLQQRQPERQALEHFKTHRADVLAQLQRKSLDAQERIIDTLDDGVIKALTPSQKSSFLLSLNITTGTSFDKERLQRGQSTSNQSILSRLVDETVKNLYKPKPTGREEGAAEPAAE
jgi:IS30 family transposase